MCTHCTASFCWILRGWYGCLGRYAACSRISTAILWMQKTCSIRGVEKVVGTSVTRKIASKKVLGWRASQACRPLKHSCCCKPRLSSMSATSLRRAVSKMSAGHSCGTGSDRKRRRHIRQQIIELVLSPSKAGLLLYLIVVYPWQQPPISLS